MIDLELDGADWRRRDDFYDAVFAILGASKWHGRNFNALRDSIGAGQINNIEPPYRFVITGRARMTPEAQSIVADFCDLIRELKQEGHSVDVVCD